MSDTLRARTIRLAASLPKGSKERRALLDAVRVAGSMGVLYDIPAHGVTTIPTNPKLNLQLMKWETEVGYWIALALRGGKVVLQEMSRTEQEADKHLARVLQVYENKLSGQEKARADRKSIPMSIKVGDIFVVSWGYDQTNVNFYETVETTPRAIKIREVEKKIVRESGSQAYVMPIPGMYKGPAVAKIPRGNSFKSDYGTASLWDGNPEPQTASGYGH